MTECQKIHYSIHDLPPSERPRERLLKHGPEAMSSIELIAIIFGSGSRNISVLNLAQQILMQFGSLQKLSEATISELCEIKGVGLAKALQLKAALNLGLRTSKQTQNVKFQITHPIHAYHFIKDEIEKEQKELFYTILQDVKGCVISHHLISIGTLSNVLVHPREVFHPAIRHHAASIILAHNHPSGDPTPSSQDYEITKNLCDAGKVIGIPVNDHIIVGQASYISLRQKGFKFI